MSPTPRWENENREPRTKFEAFLFAAGKGDIGAIREALASGIPVEFAEEYCTPLSQACLGGHVDAAKYLLDCGASPDWPTGEALRDAASMGFYRVVQLLLEHGADPCKASGDHQWLGLTPLGVVCESLHREWSEPWWLDSNRDYVECARLLLEAGADPNAQCCACLELAVEKGEKGLEKLLLRYGARRRGNEPAMKKPRGRNFKRGWKKG